MTSERKFSYGLNISICAILLLAKDILPGDLFYIYACSGIIFAIINLFRLRS